jgi:uncharacterized membrane protein
LSGAAGQAKAKAMKPLPAALSLLLLPIAGCATSDAPYSPTREVQFSAIGQEPFWLLSVGRSKIVLTFGPGEAGNSSLRDQEYRGVRTSFADGIKRWDAGDGTAVISVEARPGECTGPRGARFAEQVRVRLGGRELHGCGGRPIEEGRG